MSNPNTQALSDAGVSIWLDDLSRDLLETGRIAELIKEHNVVGLTSNPSIFQAAMSKGTATTTTSRRRRRPASRPTRSCFELTTADVREACDLFLPVYEPTRGVDGRVSIEVDPHLAHETEATVEQAKQLYAAVDRPNVLIKIPATKAGLPAITATIAEGISVNVTPIFSLDRYRAVMNAYLEGLEKANAAGKDLSTIHSVASFFVSRVDTEIDKRLDAIGTDEAKACAAGPASPTPVSPTRPSRRSSAPHAGRACRRGSPTPAPAVGLDRRQGPGLPGHPLRHRARGPRHGQHDAGEDARRDLRPR